MAWPRTSGINETKLKEQNKSAIMLVGKLQTHVQYIWNKNEVKIFLNVTL